MWDQGNGLNIARVSCRTNRAVGEQGEGDGRLAGGGWAGAGVGGLFDRVALQEHPEVNHTSPPPFPSVKDWGSVAELHSHRT